MTQSTVSAVETHLREQAAAYCAASKVPGYLAGVYHDGKQAVVAHGVANVVTGAPMREDTGFLFGSVTKVLTTTLVLQQVERGLVDLDERVITYLPAFTLTTPGAAEQILVRHLLTHTNGIDADLYFPVLRPDGLVLLSFHMGRERRHLDEWWGEPVALDFHFFERPVIERWAEGAGFLIQAHLERQPYLPHEVATQRAYLLMRKPPS